MKAIQSAKTFGTSVEIHFDDDKILTFQDCWLRDNCRCNNCYHADKFQRAQNLLDIPEAKIVNVDFTNTQLKVIWNDKHESTYECDFLSQFDYNTWKENRRFNPVLWHGEEVSKKVIKINVNDFLNSVKGAKGVFQSLLDHGVALIQGVDATVEGTEAVCNALGGVQHTMFGGMYHFTSRADHADTAYTNLPLATHNDNTYFTEAAGLQILHCIEHTNGTGGETVLVDGYYGAMRLKEEHQKYYDFLTTFDVEAEYIEGGHYHRHSAPVIQINSKTKDITQIRFNVYDRAPMAFANNEECKSYYRSLRSLARYYEDSNNQWIFKLQPGTVMAVDNFRILHGRTAFTGYRVLCGSYVSRSDWLDKARVLGLIQ